MGMGWLGGGFIGMAPTLPRRTDASYLLSGDTVSPLQQSVIRFVVLAGNLLISLEHVPRRNTLCTATRGATPAPMLLRNAGPQPAPL